MTKKDSREILKGLGFDILGKDILETFQKNTKKNGNWTAWQSRAIDNPIRYAGKCLTHLGAILKGEWLDDDGVPHYAKVCINAMMFAWGMAHDEVKK